MDQVDVVPSGGGTAIAVGAADGGLSVVGGVILIRVGGYELYKCF